MKVLTHIAAAELTWFAGAALFEVSYPPEAIAVAAAASLVPDMDTPESWAGFLTKPLSERIAARWPHRGMLHSALALLGFAALLTPLFMSEDLSVLAWAAVAGYWSHLWADMMSLTGVPLFWPSDLRAIFPGRDEFRVRTGSSQERIFFFAVLALAILFYPVSQEEMSALINPGPGDPEWAKVREVYDGDTFKIGFASGGQKVRLMGVDTPEVWGREECYGPEASQFAKQHLKPGTSVKLKTSSSLGDKTDSYGRLLAYVYLDLDGDDELEMLNKALLRQGYATLTGFKHDLQRDFREIAERAEEAGRGLWSACRGR